MAEVLGPGRVFTGTPDGDWTDIGAAEGFALQHVVIAEEALAVTVTRLAEATATLTISGAKFITAMDESLRWLHDLDRACYPRKHRRCHVCHPAWSRPLAVDGSKYHRRQLARAKGRRR